MFEVRVVEAHQDSHARTFNQPEPNVKHFFAEAIIRLANVVFIDGEPDKVGECEDEGDDGICAALSPQGVHHFAIVLFFSLDRSLCLDEQPDHQRDHHDDLAQEADAKYDDNLTTMIKEGILIVPFLMR